MRPGVLPMRLCLHVQVITSEIDEGIDERTYQVVPGALVLSTQAPSQGSCFWRLHGGVSVFQWAVFETDLPASVPALCELQGLTRMHATAVYVACVASTLNHHADIARPSSLLLF